MLIFAAAFAVPTMAVATNAAPDFVSYQALDSPVVISVDLGADIGIVSQFRRTSVVAYKSQSEKPETNHVITANSCMDGCHQTGYSSNEVGWQL